MKLPKFVQIVESAPSRHGYPLYALDVHGRTWAFNANSNEPWTPGWFKIDRLCEKKDVSSE